MFKIIKNEDLLKAIKPISNKYANIDNPYELYDILNGLWSKDTCAPRLRDKWSDDNKTVGQCSITAFLTQDIFGGEVYGVEIGDGNYHCFNKVGECIFDLTSEQFKENLNYTLDNKQCRLTHFNKKEKEERYNLLKDKLDLFLNRNC